MIFCEMSNMKTINIKKYGEINPNSNKNKNINNIVFYIK